jgi:hypothetical protein
VEVGCSIPGWLSEGIDGFHVARQISVRSQLPLGLAQFAGDLGLIQMWTLGLRVRACTIISFIFFLLPSNSNDQKDKYIETTQDSLTDSPVLELPRHRSHKCDHCIAGKLNTLPHPRTQPTLKKV